MDSLHGQKDGSAYTNNPTWYTTTTKKKNKRDYLNRCRKQSFDKIPHPFIKTLTKVSIEGTHLNIINYVYDKPAVKVILSEELKISPVNAVTKWGCPGSWLLFHTGLEVLLTAIGQGKETKGIQIRKEEVKLPLYADDIILYRENTKDTTPKLLELANEFSKGTG